MSSSQKSSDAFKVLMNAKQNAAKQRLKTRLKNRMLNKSTLMSNVKSANLIMI